ncbi:MULTISPECIES: CynX/NimT family MFS transporter [unclassified Pseudomonas]|uniref:CynX/NimT family MFS transporter n=1 Tax=unclassified Pseudomonas TaxID=196821 RepID=UPI00087193B2|nr:MULTISPECIES: CynX/NimT family MFS transporter [unclassified Pseudomonas]SCW67415.1 MFS transporter, CP family, cyanate transporter [Pseudomonas sp. NFACC05-1]SCZ36643.1 MFS transporter, CP family, cyanate transporter [Pseudomonas sp. NFACC44-2]SDA61368.1 MFS transporter, CP family, cyanate transporter [Pseudomonas sp. NFACC51]SFI90663.1 MFS transporter, CP family, cyanate transporter [Pseudomonas sp. NFACC54]SFL84734.1 MFS transporter, CP family, cyanate transporter [Pseudomonas sp. NFACC4
MSRDLLDPATSTAPKRAAELEELLIDAEADDEQAQQRPPLVRRPWLLLLGLILVALNLRPALSSMAPLLSEVSRSLDLSAAQAGLLTTLPVLCLGLFAPLAPVLARRFGAERVVLGILLTLAGGIVLRSAFGQVGLFVGSILAGASIGVIGVLLPGIVKRDFAKQAGTMTGVYTMALCLGAAMAAGATVPLSEQLGHSWALGLGFWVVPALLASVFWLPQVGEKHGAHQVAYRVRGLLRDPLAWQVTLYMGLQSSLAYIVFGWLPSILIGRGLTPTQAGLVLSGSVIVQLISSLAAPWLATRGKDQRLAIVIVMLMVLGGLFGSLYAPLDGLWGWAILLGLGQGGSFSLALTLIVLRSRDAHVAANLSGMAQGFGYTLASLGPFAVGVVHDLTGGWNALGWIFGLVGLGAIIAGIGAGRALYVGVSSERVADLR